jgi:hypothetical protein
MSFSGIRAMKKLLYEVDIIQSILTEARSELEYCIDNTGSLCDGRPDEVEGSKEHAEGLAIDHLLEIREKLNEILEKYGE